MAESFVTSIGTKIVGFIRKNLRFIKQGSQILTTANHHVLLNLMIVLLVRMKIITNASNLTNVSTRLFDVMVMNNAKKEKMKKIVSKNIRKN